MANMEYRQAELSKRSEQLGYACHGVGIVATLTGGLPLVKGALNVNNDKRDVSGEVRHARHLPSVLRMANRMVAEGPEWARRDVHSLSVAA